MSFQQSATPLLLERPAGAPLDSLSSAQQTSSRSNAETTRRTAGQQWIEETGGSPAAASSSLGSVAGGEATAAATPIDQRLRTNIQIIRNNLLSIQENLGNLNKRLVSRRIVEGLHDRLRETYEVVLATERLFKTWKAEQQQQQTLDPLERQRVRFLYEKLSSHFQEEIKNVQEISERVREAAERVAGESSSSRRSAAAGAAEAVSAGAAERAAGGSGGACGTAATAAADASSVAMTRGEAPAAARLNSSSSSSHAWSASSHLRRDNTGEQQSSSSSRGRGSNSSSKRAGGTVLDLENIAMVGTGDDDPDFFLNDDEQELCSEMEEVAEHESLLQRVVAEERYRGLQRIHGQVRQANQIFRDLAQLVLQQDSGVDAIDAQMHTARSHIKGAATELYKARQMQRRSRLRRCALLLLVFVVVSFLLYFYSPFSSVQHVPPTPADKETALLQQKQQQEAAAEEEDSELTAGQSDSRDSAPGLSGAAATALAATPLQTSFGTRFVPSASASQSMDAAMSAEAEAADSSQVAHSSSHPASLGRFFQGRTPSSS